MVKISVDDGRPGRRPPHGGRGLKFGCRHPRLDGPGRPPHGGRGLKSQAAVCAPLALTSSPSRGTWIEIPVFDNMYLDTYVVPLTGDVD